MSDFEDAVDRIHAIVELETEELARRAAAIRSLAGLPPIKTIEPRSDYL